MVFFATSGSFSLGSLQACCVLCLEYSFPLYSVPPKGRDRSRIIFCFKFLGPVSASCQIHKKEMSNQACMLLIAHTLLLGVTDLNRGVRRVLALQIMQPAFYSSHVCVAGSIPCPELRGLKNSAWHPAGEGQAPRQRGSCDHNPACALGSPEEL